ncbi:WD40 repeat domain-containing protein, partial [Mesorhizobium sp. M7A.F.Ca.CA.004.05.1.1]
MNKGADRLLALALVVVAVGCLARIYWPAFGEAFLWRGFSGPPMDPASLRLAGFLVAAFACLLGAGLFWAGLLPDRSGQAAGAPLFGRAAEMQDVGTPGLRRVFLVLPLVVVAALAADRFGPWHEGGDIASEPVEPKADEPNPGEPKANEPKG